MPLGVSGMDNKIQLLGQNNVARSARGSVAQASDKAVDSGNGAPEASTLSLSDTTIKLRQLEEKLAGMPVADKSRVDAIKLALANNSYKVNAENIADKLLNTEHDLPVSKD